ncbi:flagellar basal body-associated FliL family protein [Qingshengfaniella alkalisoli]|uniref:Flagellar protein FliL n=1 Tax=Qingshengfaniella alkalisoli TaxID=2599296 RepID=A0A5B8J740_9RHOB|nr:flagellar basal body-associated FliL family protein [Qingshengfaniella alkalisoli]QDY70150.1 flagellar basal body-associated FliL family protein [Qingshengfaniella alkalisoli]
MAKLLPAILALVGIGAGVGAGLHLKSDTVEEMEHTTECIPPNTPTYTLTEPKKHADGPSEFVTMSNQFVVPVFTGDGVDAMVMLSLNLEVGQGHKEELFKREPKIRDAFLRALFEHSNAGGFDGNFIEMIELDSLRSALREAAAKTAGPMVRDVLIADLVKQKV